MGRGGAIVGLNVVQRRVSTGDIDIPEELASSKEAGNANEDALARSVVGRRSTMLLNAKAGGGGGGGGDGGGGGGGGNGGDAGEAAVGTPTELKWQYADGDGIDFDDPSDVTILKKTAYTNLISGLPYVLLRCSDVNVDWNMCDKARSMVLLSTADKPATAEL
eukprot:gene20714-14940_t